MQGPIKKNFDFANKLIFAKSYEKAFKLLAKTAQSATSEELFIVHLRYIELAIKLDETADVLKQYESPQGPLAQIPEHLKHLSISFLKWHGQILSISDSKERFKTYLLNHPDSAAAYYGLGCCFENESQLEEAIGYYEKSITCDVNWAPSYFNLSQIFYDMGQEEKGDHYFFSFEKKSPYNLYGNFEIHRQIALEFLELGFYKEAEQACRSLTDWWVANKGFCPLEIKVFESSVLVKIYDHMGDKDKKVKELLLMEDQAKKVIQAPNLANYSYYFIANILEDHGYHSLALECYLAIVRKKEIDVEFLQKIGVHFFTMKAYDDVKKIFDEAYLHHPDQEDVRFCRLVSMLKRHNIPIEPYLDQKSKFLREAKASQDLVQRISSLHQLLAVCSFDPDILAETASTYMQLGNTKQAEVYYKKMHELDPLGQENLIKYANFLTQTENLQGAKKILDTIQIKKNDYSELSLEASWLKAKTYQMDKKYDLAIECLEKLLHVDPWNESYLLLAYFCFFHLEKPASQTAIDEAFLKLFKADKTSCEAFDQTTQALKKDHAYLLCYLREKIGLLHQSKNFKRLTSLVHIANIYNPMQGTKDLLKLINTNFDHPYIYMGLGELYQEMGQYENATMWYEQTLAHLMLTEEIKMITYKNMALCYVLLGRNLMKAIEYTKMVIESGIFKQSDQLLSILAHAYLKNGDMKQAQTCLDQMEQKNSFESQYLLGLVQYRNGFKKNAKLIWKSLISTPVKDTKNHHLKSELMKFYFDNDDYFKAS